MKAPHWRDVAVDEPGMTSMIDVVFLLLIFFVWTSSFDHPEQDIVSQIAMPESAVDAVESSENSLPQKSKGQGEAPRREQVVVRIFATDNGLRYQVGALDVAGVDELLPRLKRISALPTRVLLIVDPDDNVEFEDCIAVYDHAIRLGFPQVLFAVE